MKKIALSFFLLLMTVLLQTACASDEKTDDREKDLRKFPYPYSAMLSITSDLDGSTLDEFEMYHRYLNTNESTDFGTGLGMDVGDSFWMYIGAKKKDKKIISDQSDTMTWFHNTDIKREKHAEHIKKYYYAGWIDSIHTYGDFSHYGINKNIKPTRQMAIDAWEALSEAKVYPEIWICHGDEANIQNFGAYSKTGNGKYQEGDNPDSEAYHTDLALKNGIKFVWNDYGDDKFFGLDNPLREVELRDGQKVWGFSRYTGPVKLFKKRWTWSPDDIPEFMNKKNLEKLIKDEKFCLIGMHFGTYKDHFPFDKKTREALLLLRDYDATGKIMVTRTSRQLNYYLAWRYTKYEKKETENGTEIDLISIDDPVLGSSKPTLDKVRGLTFYVDDAEKADIFINGKKLPESMVRRVADEPRQTIGIRWFGKDVTDYTKEENKVAIPNNVEIISAGEKNAVRSYMIDGYNYLPLREVIKILENEGVYYEIVWDNKTRAIDIQSAKELESNKDIEDENIYFEERSEDYKVGKPANVTLKLNGADVFADGFEIDNENYYMLRDMGSVLNFSVKIKDDDILIKPLN